MQPPRSAGLPLRLYSHILTAIEQCLGSCPSCPALDVSTLPPQEVVQFTPRDAQKFRPPVEWIGDDTVVIMPAIQQMARHASEGPPKLKSIGKSAFAARSIIAGEMVAGFGRGGMAEADEWAELQLSRECLTRRRSRARSAMRKEGW